MRLSLFFAVVLLSGCLTVKSTVIDGVESSTTYLGLLPLSRSTQPACPVVEFDQNRNVIGVATPAGIVPLGVEFDFVNAKWIAEEITVTSETTSLPYGNGEVIGVELGDHESMKLIRIAMKGEDGSLQVVNYDFVPNSSAPPVRAKTPPLQELVDDNGRVVGYIGDYPNAVVPRGGRDIFLPSARAALQAHSATPAASTND